MTATVREDHVGGRGFFAAKRPTVRTRHPSPKSVHLIRLARNLHDAHTDHSRREYRAGGWPLDRDQARSGIDLNTHRQFRSVGPLAVGAHNRVIPSRCRRGHIAEYGAAGPEKRHVARASLCSQVEQQPTLHGDPSVHPSFVARNAASTRLRTPSFRKISWMWDFTVFSLRCTRSAISRLE